MTPVMHIIELKSGDFKIKEGGKYYHSVKSTLSFFETFPPIKLLLRTIVVVCHFKSI